MPTFIIASLAPPTHLLYGQTEELLQKDIWTKNNNFPKGSNVRKEPVFQPCEYLSKALFVCSIHFNQLQYNASFANKIS